MAVIEVLIERTEDGNFHISRGSKPILSHTDISPTQAAEYLAETIRYHSAVCDTVELRYMDGLGKSIEKFQRTL